MRSGDHGSEIWRAVANSVEASPTLTLAFYGGLISVPASCRSEGEPLEVSSEHGQRSEWEQLGMLLATLDCAWLDVDSDADTLASG